MKTEVEVYAEDHLVLTATLDVPDEIYCSVLTKLFNNKRDEKSILELNNYYSNNKISIAIDLNEYGSDAVDKGEKDILEWLKNIGTELVLVDGEYKEYNSKITHRVGNARIYIYESIYEPTCTLPTYNKIEW